MTSNPRNPTQSDIGDGGMSGNLVRYMVSRFLQWKLPENFRPDGGISFKPFFNEHTEYSMRAEPCGTNLFDAQQAEAMVRHMLEGAPHEAEITRLREQLAEAETALVNTAMQRDRAIALTEKAQDRQGELMDKLAHEIEAHAETQAALRAMMDDLAEARARADMAFAAGIEAAAGVVEAYSEYDGRLCCDGHMCGCQGATVHETILHYIRALTPPDITAAAARVLLTDADAVLIMAKAAHMARPAFLLETWDQASPETRSRHMDMIRAALRAIADGGK